MSPTGEILTWALGTLAALGVVSSSAAGEPAVVRELEGTHWTLVELDGAIVDEDGPHEVYLVFDGETRRVEGSGGCNRLTGGYERNGDRLRLRRLAATRRACLQGMDIEASFLAALERVRRFRIDEERLSLVGPGGRALAVFEARGGAAGKVR
jgi:heat shock protein HslJ